MEAAKARGEGSVRVHHLKGWEDDEAEKVAEMLLQRGFTADWEGADLIVGWTE